MSLCGDAPRHEKKSEDIYKSAPDKKSAYLYYFLLTIPVLLAITALNVCAICYLAEYKVFSFAPKMSIILLPLFIVNFVPVYYLFILGIKKVKHSLRTVYYATEKTLFIEKDCGKFKDVKSIDFADIKSYAVEKSFSGFTKPVSSVIVYGENKILKLKGIKTTASLIEILKSKNINELSEDI